MTITALMDGVSFIARSAAKKRAALAPAGSRRTRSAFAITFGDIDEAIHQTLDH